MAPTAYSLSATPPLKRTEKTRFGGALRSASSHPHPPSHSHPSQPPASRGVEQLPPSPARPGFFKRFARGGGGGGGRDPADAKAGLAGGGEGGRIPWETTSSPAVVHTSPRTARTKEQAGEALFSSHSPPASPTRSRPHQQQQEQHRVQQYPRPSHRPPYSPSSSFSFDPSPPLPSSSSRQPFQHHRQASSSSDGYSLLFASGIHNIKKGAAASAGAGEYSDEEEEKGLGLSPSKYGSTGRTKGGLKSLVKKGSKFSLRSLVHHHGAGGPSSSHSPPDSPGAGPGAVEEKQTQSLPLPSTSRFPSSSPHSSSHDFGRRPSIPSSFHRADPPPRPPLVKELSISSPSFPRGAEPTRVGGSFLTPLPSPRSERERKGSGASAGLWALGGGGEEAQTPKGSVRGKAAKLLGEEVVPSGKAARLLGMERKKTLVKNSMGGYRPSAMSLSAESANSQQSAFDRRPSVATTFSLTPSYDSPPSSFPPTPGLAQTASSPKPNSNSRSLRRRSSSDPNLLFPSSASEPWSSPERPHRTLAEEDPGGREDDELWAPPSPPRSPALAQPQTPPRRPTLDTDFSATTLDAETSSPPPTSDYAGSSPRGSSPSLSQAETTNNDFSFPPTTSSPHRASLTRARTSPERVLSFASTASSSYGIPSTYFPFSHPTSSSSFSFTSSSAAPLSPTGLPVSAAPFTGGFTSLSSNPNRLSPDSIRFSVLAQGGMGPEGFLSSPSNHSLRSDSPASQSTTRLSRVGTPGSAGGGGGGVKRPSLGGRSYSASSTLTTSSARHASLTFSSSPSSRSAPSTAALSPPPPPPFPPPSTPASSSSKPKRSNTHVSVASSRTRGFERSHALEALEGRKMGRAVGAEEERGSRKKALQMRGLRALREEGSSGSSREERQGQEMGGGREKEEREKRRRAVRESKPFLSLGSSSEEDEDEEEGDDEEMEQGRDRVPRRTRQATNESLLTVQSSSSASSSLRSPSPHSPASSSSRTTSLARSLSARPPPRSPLPTPPASNSRERPPPPPPPSSSSPSPGQRPTSPSHPYARSLSPSSRTLSNPLPPPPSSLPIKREHNRHLSAASYASLSSPPTSAARTFERSMSVSSAGSGMSDYSTFSAVENAFPLPPSAGGAALSFSALGVASLAGEGGGGPGEEVYRFPSPPAPSKRERQASTSALPVFGESTNSRAVNIGLGLLAMDRFEVGGGGKKGGRRDSEESFLDFQRG
ncbi:hypothetical protein JCM8547_001341 [Rhodosporidiobolus lusitaniae]